MNRFFLSHIRPELRFLLAAAGLYSLWVLGVDVLLGPHNSLDRALSTNLAWMSAAALRLVGQAATTTLVDAQVLVLNGYPAVVVGDPCNGLVLYGLFAGFILAFPGPLRPKLWFVPLGIAVIYALNIARIALLALNHAYWRATVEFNHHYTFTLAVYGAIGFLWFVWARRSAQQAPPLLV